MDIYARSGHKVLVTVEGMNSGYEHHKETAKKYLVVGKTYTVDHTDVSSWHTDVYLQEIPGIAFNSVHFIDAKEEQP